MYDVCHVGSCVETVRVAIDVVVACVFVLDLL
jgi:hypothetical protein